MRGFNSDLIGVFHSWAVHLRKNRAVKSPKNYRSPADEQRNYQAARPHFVEAATLYSQGELSQAETALERHLRMAPQSWPGLCLKALLAEQTHRVIGPSAVLDRVAFDTVLSHQRDTSGTSSSRARPT